VVTAKAVKRLQTPRFGVVEQLLNTIKDTGVVGTPIYQVPKENNRGLRVSYIVQKLRKQVGATMNIAHCDYIARTD
jgi:hypothetical protein